MVKSYQISKPGDPNVLKLKKFKHEELKPHQLKIKNNFIPINHMDVHHRNGTYSIGELPQALGIAGVGTVIETGRAVRDIKAGDLVGYATCFLGSYSEEVIIERNIAFGLNKDLPLDLVAATIVPALTAHYLIFRTYFIKKEDFVLVNGASGAVGSMIAQWVSSLGGNVIGVVGSKAKIAVAKSNGCKNVIDYNSEDVLQRVLEITDNNGVNVIYDCYGKKFFEQNCACLTYLGILVNYGDTTGIIDNFDPTKLWAKSLFYTKPNLSLYKSNQMELVLSTETIFKAVKDKILRPNYKVVDFKDIPNIHQQIEARKVIGSYVARVA